MNIFFTNFQPKDHVINHYTKFTTPILNIQKHIEHHQQGLITMEL